MKEIVGSHGKYRFNFIRICPTFDCIIFALLLAMYEIYGFSAYLLVHMTIRLLLLLFVCLSNRCAVVPLYVFNGHYRWLVTILNIFQILACHSYIFFSGRNIFSNIFLLFSFHFFFEFESSSFSMNSNFLWDITFPSSVSKSVIFLKILLTASFKEKLFLLISYLRILCLLLDDLYFPLKVLKFYIWVYDLFLVN